MEAKERIIKAKIELQESHPFFSYILMHMTFEENKEINSMAVDEYGNCMFCSEFVDKLSMEEIKFAVCHEMGHIIFEHLKYAKLGNRDPEIHNVASDIVINDMLKTNNFQLPDGILETNSNHSITIFDETTVDDVDKKCSEEVYDEIYKPLKKKKDERDKLIKKLFDKHIRGKGNGNGQSTAQQNQNSKKWKQVISNAANYAKNIGKLPGGMERIVEDLLDSKVSWKQKLYRYVVGELMSDYSYHFPAKRSLATGVYMPCVKKENVDIVVAVDTSGSIGGKELTEFLTEVCSLALSFENVNMNVLFIGAHVAANYEVNNANIEKIMALKPRGGGGTSFTPAIDWINKNKPDSKLLIYFTDGYGNIVEETISGDVIWVIPSNGTEEYVKKNQGSIIRM